MSGQQTMEMLKNQRRQFEDYVNSQIPSSFRDLFLDLVEENPINVYVNSRSIAADPVSLTILFAYPQQMGAQQMGAQKMGATESQNYSDILKQYPAIKPQYDALVAASRDYMQATTSYKSLLGIELPSLLSSQPTLTSTSGDQSIMKLKLDYDAISSQLYNLLTGLKEKTEIEGIDIQQFLSQNVDLRNQLFGLVNKLFANRKEQFTFIQNLFSAMESKINSVIAYFQALQTFYFTIKDYKKTEQKNSIYSTFTSEVLNFDLAIFDSLLQEFGSFIRINDLYTQIHIIKTRCQKYIDEGFNSKNLLTLYLNNPDLLLLQGYELDIYIFGIMVDYESFDQELWRIITVNSKGLLKEVQDVIQTKMRDVRTFVENISTNPITPKQRQQIMLVYNYITLYAQLSTVVFAREMTYNTSQQNVLSTLNQRRRMYIKFNMKSKEFVDARKLQVLLQNTQLIKELITSSILETGTTGANIDAWTRNLRQNIEKSSMELETLKQTIQTLEQDYNIKLDLFIPEFSNKSTKDQCLQITAPRATLTQAQENFQKKQTTFLNKLQLEYNASATTRFRENIGTILQQGIDEGIVVLNDKTTKTNQWKIYGGYSIEGVEEKDSLLKSVAMAFNANLFQKNARTNSTYADGGYYTEASLMRVISDNENIEDEGNRIKTLERIFNVKFIVVEDIDYNMSESSKDVPVGARVKVKNAEGRLVDGTITDKVPLIYTTVIKFSTSSDAEKNRYNNFFETIRGQEITVFYGANLKITGIVTYNTSSLDGRKFIIGLTVNFHKLLQKGTKIALYLGDTENDIKNGIIISVKPEKNKNATNIVNTDDYKYTILLPNNSKRELTTITTKSEGLNENNFYVINPQYLINCDVSKTPSPPANGPEIRCIILLKVKMGEKNFYYSVSYSNPNDTFMFELQNLPDTIKFFIFNSCFRAFIQQDIENSRTEGNRMNRFFAFIDNYQRLQRFRKSKIETGKLSITADDIANFKLAFGKYDSWYTKNTDLYNDILETYGIPYAYELYAKKKFTESQRGGAPPLANQLPVTNMNAYIDLSTSQRIANVKNDHKLSYYIVIDLELFPGEKLTMANKAVLNCQSKYEKIRQSFAQLFGIQYKPIEFSTPGFVVNDTKNKDKTSIFRPNVRSTRRIGSNLGRNFRRPEQYTRRLK